MLFCALLLALPAGVAAATPTAGAGGADLSGRPLAETDRVSAAKGESGRPVRSDPEVLRATSPDPAPVLVKLDYDAVAAYTGGVPGIAATSPSVTGHRLAVDGPDVAAYSDHVAGIEQAFVSELAAAVPQASVGARLRTVYGGVAVSLPADRAKDLLALPGVVAVQADTRNRLLSDGPITPTLTTTAGTATAPPAVAALAIAPAPAPAGLAGQETIVGVLDSGVWPEHPAFVDPGLPAPPAKSDGTKRTCMFDANPLTATTEPFVCTNKLISGEPFLDTYTVTVGGETYPQSARDSEGHGTHTASTAVGSPVAQTPIFGIDHGAVAGVAPGAHLAVYKVCGQQGCYSSDSVAAVQQAILDGVDVINYSISGGTDPYTDPVELAFLDAYQAGVFVAASAGNEGPAAGTVNHLGPWVTTVAAATPQRQFQTTLTLSAGAETFTAVGSSITQGSGDPAPVVLAGAAPYRDPRCEKPAAPDVFAGRIVTCERGVNSRVGKGWNVLQGGAAGMVLYNPTAADSETDNHWLPTVQLADGAAFLAFLTAHADVTGSFPAGAAADGRADVVADFSSRGPGGSWLKPDVTAPGVQILAGHTPTPDSIDGGPPGEYYQAIAGTSMAAPHVAGAGAVLAALHPTWTPGQIHSALTTTAATTLVTASGSTPATAYDIGAGRIDPAAASDPGLTFDVPTAAFMEAGDPGPRGGVDLNLPAIDVPLLTGEISTTRTATNTTGTRLHYRARATAPDGARITVSPAFFSVAPGAQIELTIRIDGSRLAAGQYFGQLTLDNVGGPRDLHLPVSFTRGEGDLTLETTCAPTAITLVPRTASTCTVTATNNADPTTVSLTSTLSGRLQLTSLTASGTNSSDRGRLDQPTTLTFTDRPIGGRAGVPSVAPGTLAGYRPLADLGIAATTIGDEEIVNVDVPAFVYAGASYTRIGVTSDGYLIVGGGAGQGDISFQPQQLPHPFPPNNVLAPFWTDLDGTGAPGVFIGTITDGTDSWIAVEWQVYEFGTENLEVFQAWIGVNGVEDITFAYDPEQLPTAPAALNGLAVGAENVDGTQGGAFVGVPTADLRVSSSTGGTVAYSFTVQGLRSGPAQIRTSLTSPSLPGTTTAFERLTVTRR